MYFDKLPSVPTELPLGGLRALLRAICAPDEMDNPAPRWTGKLCLHDPVTGRDGAIWLYAGGVYAVEFTGFVPPMAARLHSAGVLDDAQLAEFSELDPAEVGPHALAQGLIAQNRLDDLNRQMALSSLTHLYGWEAAHWWFEVDAETELFAFAPVDLHMMVASADERIGQWDALVRNYPTVTKAHAVPRPGPDWNNRYREESSPEALRVLDLIDGVSSVARIGTLAGFTRFDIAGRLAKALSENTIILPDPDHVITVPGIAPMTASDDPELSAAHEAVEAARAALAAAEEHFDHLLRMRGLIAD